MELTTAVVIIAAIAAAVAIYAITQASSGAAKDRSIKHTEFMASLEPGHRETLAKVAANRDAEIAKATHKEPASIMDMKRVQSNHPEEG